MILSTTPYVRHLLYYQAMHLKENRMHLHGRSWQLTVTPAQMAAPVQFETLSVAVCRADGQTITGKKVRLASTAFSQSLSFIYLIALQSLLSSGVSHGYCK